MNSLRIKFIASSMVIILSAGQAFGMGTQSTLSNGTTVVVTPDLNGQGVTGVNVLEKPYTGILDKQRFSDVINYSKDKLRNVKNKALDICSTTGQRTMDIVSNVKAHPYKTAGYTLAAAATTAGVIYGVRKYKKNTESKNAKLSILIQQAAENGNFVAANALINELILPEAQKDDIRNRINTAIQNQIMGKIANMPVVRNTNVVEPVKAVVKSAVKGAKNAATEVKKATKDVVDSVSSTVQDKASSVKTTLSNLLSDMKEFAKTTSNNAEQTAKEIAITTAIETLELTQAVKLRIKRLFNRIIYATSNHHLKSAQQDLDGIINSL